MYLRLSVSAYRMATGKSQRKKVQGQSITRDCCLVKGSYTLWLDVGMPGFPSSSATLSVTAILSTHVLHGEDPNT